MHQKAREGGAVKGTWNKWSVRKRLVGLCRESPFTGLASEATFAIQMMGLTINQVRSESIVESRTRGALLLNIIKLYDACEGVAERCERTIISCYVRVSAGCDRDSPGTIKTAYSFFN